MKFAAIYSIVVGTGMIGQWTMSFISKQIPELVTEPIRIWFHIAAELITAIMLIISGVGLLSSAAWSRTLNLIAIGMLFYTCIVSPGYFAQQGNWAWLVMFSAIILLGIISLVLCYK